MLVQAQHTPESVLDLIEGRQESLTTGGRHRIHLLSSGSTRGAGRDTTVQLLVCRAWYVRHVLAAVGPR